MLTDKELDSILLQVDRHVSRRDAVALRAHIDDLEQRVKELEKELDKAVDSEFER
jgi:polyhydroxyalkanoate synthesis regulator phasin